MSTLTVNGKGLVTAAGQTSISITALQVSDFSSAADARVAAAAATGTGNLVRATSPTLVTPVLGTPASGTLTNCTGLPAAGVVSGTLIGFKAYNGADYPIAGTSLADVDATNLSVTFTAPASGNVLVRLTAFVYSDSEEMFFGVRESTTNVVPKKRAAVDAGAIFKASISHAFTVTGISAGSHTYKFAAAIGGAGNEASLFADSSFDNPPAVIEVVALP